MGELRPLGEDLTQESRALAQALRELFEGLDVSVRRYAARHRRDPGTFSRIAGDSIPPISPQMNPPVDLPGLRQALNDLKPVQLQWDGTAITETERELESMSFESWWRELFHEDYRTFTSPPPSRLSHNWGGGTGTGGTGGFTGGFSFGGY